MIIVRISEGLGNQMFQYAAARRLAHFHGTELKLDLITYYPYNRRPFRSGEQRFSVRTYAPHRRSSASVGCHVAAWWNAWNACGSACARPGARGA